MLDPTEASLIAAIGNTPLVRLHRLASDLDASIWLKIESTNPTGSYKDRMALSVVGGAERARTAEGRRLLECTGGSTGTSLAFVCAALRRPLTIVSSDAYAPAKLASMRALGAELLIEPSVEGRVTPDLWPRMRARAAALVEAGTHLWLDQFENPDVPTAYGHMGREIVEQGAALGLPRIDAFCGMVGTAGMLVGAGAAIAEANPGARIVAVEPESSAVLSGGTAGAHGIDGTAAGFVPPHFDRAIVPETLALAEADGREMARRLAQEEGIFAGTSTGMNVLAALHLARDLDHGANVVTVACDSGFKYLDGDLFDPQSS